MMGLILYLLVGMVALGAPPPALSNFGNSCYMNATLQLLLCMDTLNTIVSHPTTMLPATSLSSYYNHVLKAYEKKEPITTELVLFFHMVDLWLNQPRSMHIIEQLFKAKEVSQDLVSKLSKQIDDALDALHKKNVVSQERINSYSFARNFLLEPTLWSLVQNKVSTHDLETYFENQIIAYSPFCTQQDAGQALSVILESLQNNLPGSSRLMNLGVIDKIIEYNTIVYYQNPVQQLLTTLPVKKASLLELIDFYVHEEKREHYEKLRVFDFLPLYMIFELRRLVSEYDFNNSEVIVPAELSFSQDWLYDVAPQTYALKAVIIHSGGGSGGHYTAYVYAADAQRWFYCNDATITQLGSSLSPQEQEHINRYATIILYEVTKTSQVDFNTRLLQDLYHDLSVFVSRIASS